MPMLEETAVPAASWARHAVHSEHLDCSRNMLIRRMLYADFKCEDNSDAQHSVVVFALHVIRVWVECAGAQDVL